MTRLVLDQALDAQYLAALLQEQGLAAETAATKAGLLVQGANRLATAGVGRRDPVNAFFVPGRIEVLGKHTDYAGGRSLVTAVDRGICLVAAPRTDARIRLWDAVWDQQVDFDFTPQLEPSHGHWSNYPMTVARRLARNFPGPFRGANIALGSDLPAAAGMSSSSALIIATYLALAALNDLEGQNLYQSHITGPFSLAEYLGTIENGQSFGELAGDKGVGTFGGSEDHTAILYSKPGQVGQFQYCPTRFECYIPVPDQAVWVVGFSGVVAEKTGAAQDLYNRASALAGAVVTAWQEATGGTEPYLAGILARHADANQLRRLLQGAQQPTFTPDELIRRLDHFMAENEEIIVPAGQALGRGDFDAFGTLVDRSQALSDSLLGNQVPQTVSLAQTARQSGAWAASAFGAGFGGSVWALVEGARVEAFVEEWSRRYRAAFADLPQAPQFFQTQSGPAAFSLD
ncbi:MAG: galactokinase [Candidatus Latescibacteria bacterium]|nr:galactokinase [Candidatus Latescibacterota bacterium]